MGSSLKIIFDHCFTIVFSGYCFYVFFFFFQIFISFRIFYFTRTMKIITGRSPWVLTEESPRLATMDDSNTLAVFAGYYTRSLFPLTAFLNGVSRIHQGLINLNDIKTPDLECLLPCIERNSLCYNIFVSSQKLSCRHKPIYNSKLIDPSTSSGSPHFREMTDTQAGFN